jgi:PhoH-like ATPase
VSKAKAGRTQRRLYVLDTNVLMHDPTALFRFQEHDIFLPMVVLEELDAGKKGMSEASRNVRQVSRFLDDMMRDVSKQEIDAGLVIQHLQNAPGAAVTGGRLFVLSEGLVGALPESLRGN